MPSPHARALAWLIVILVLATFAFAAPPASAFCGFYVGKADATLFNQASQVIMVRRDNRTVISMANDYRGDLTEFALVVPVPQVLEKSQIHIGDRKLFDRIDAFSAPRLAEYFDPDPCVAKVARSMGAMDAALPASVAKQDRKEKEKALGVTVEASYTVGEYDIAILSAKQSDGLETYLRQNGYKIPPRASAALLPYIRQNMKFFVAKVNLAEQAKTGVAWLRPLQFAFESEKFMLPVRLGMLNAKGPQDLVLYVLTPKGRVETTNYRTVKLPANMDVPTYVRSEFSKTYKAIFDAQAAREDYKVLFTEYFWDMAWCDPCAADPLTPDELKQAGVFWTDGGANRGAVGNPQPVMLTRLHLRYTRDTLPEDLSFQETADRENFQVRYVLRHPWAGDASACSEAKPYFDSVRVRQEREAQTLASLTGRDVNTIRARMSLAPLKNRWWESLWPEAKP
ncbi:MAG: DUF2330 domain-containing protein [Aromatoleum sp.]|nr:DUF2330 domain-containing protein [Aromatoleum sp.]